MISDTVFLHTVASKAARRRPVSRTNKMQGAVMKRIFGTLRSAACVMLVLAASLGACSNQAPLEDKSFVGKWQSSKASAPIRMDKNGEWELLTKEGEVVQYGVWQYFDNKLMWSVMIDRDMGHDINPVLSASAKEFKLRERDGSVTTFTRLD